MLSLPIANNLDILDARGQGCYGASSMPGHLAGLAALVKITNPFAICVLCMAHCLCLVMEKLQQCGTLSRRFGNYSKVVCFCVIISETHGNVHLRPVRATQRRGS